MKKITCALLSLLLCVVLMLSTTTVLAAEDSLLSGSLHQHGNTLLLNIDLAENAGITNGQLQIHYDSTQLELIRATGSDLWDTQSINHGTATLLFASSQPQTAGGSLVTLVFRTAAEADVYTASVSVLLRKDLETVEETVLNFSSRTFVCDGKNCPSAAFSDLSVDAWYHNDTDYVIASGLMQGFGGNAFRPNGEVSRAMIVTTLYRMAGSPRVETDYSFKDVEDGMWYAEAVAWALETGIAKGIGETTFAPNETATREQMATFLHRYAMLCLGDGATQGADLSGFSDSNDISGYAEAAMAWAVSEGLFQGFGDDTLRPGAPLTRVQLAKLLTVLEQGS
ncbi:MAG: S-layer homology domain-containing protein [Oscillospiraceae bacterium]|nr:S-layer homology domain-containing protein [Oscillospiraceae bacterium]